MYSYFISGFSTEKKLCILYFYLILLLSVILNVITMYLITMYLSWMSSIVRVLVSCIRHLDVHKFTYDCIFVRLLYIFVYIKPNK